MCIKLRDLMKYAYAYYKLNLSGTISQQTLVGTLIVKYKIANLTGRFVWLY